MSKKIFTPDMIQFLDEHEMESPLYVINDWITSNGVQHIREYINTWLPAVFGSQSWKVSEPCDLFWFYENTLKALEAASIVIELEGPKLALIEEDKIVAEIDLFHPSLYCYGYEINSPWKCFPRFLNKEEYLNPYKAIESVFEFRSLAAWKQEMRDLLHQGLSSECMEEYGEPFDLIGIQHHLLKLAESCHLLNVRNFNYANGKHLRRELPLPVAHIVLVDYASDN